MELIICPHLAACDRPRKRANADRCFLTRCCHHTETRAKALGYPSWNACIKGLIRYDSLCQGPHTITLPWAVLPLEEQDKIDAKLLTYTKKGIGERGQLLKHIMNGTTKL